MINYRQPQITSHNTTVSRHSPCFDKSYGVYVVNVCN